MNAKSFLKAHVIWQQVYPGKRHVDVSSWCRHSTVAAGLSRSIWQDFESLDMPKFLSKRLFIWFPVFSLGLA